MRWKRNLKRQCYSSNERLCVTSCGGSHIRHWPSSHRASAVSDLWLKSDRRNRQNLCCVLCCSFVFSLFALLTHHIFFFVLLCVWLWGGLIDWKVDRAALEIRRTAREAKQWCKVMRKITFTNLSIKVLLVQLQLRSEKLLHASTLAGFLWLIQSCCVDVKKRAEILPQHTQ